MDRVLQRLHLSTSEPVEATAVIRSVLGDGALTVDEGEFGFDQWAIVDEDITVARIMSHGRHVRLTLKQPQEIIGVVVRQGRLDLTRADDTATLEPGDCGLIPLLEPAHLHWDDVRAELFCLHPSTVYALLPQAAADGGRLHAPRLTPRSAELARFWNLLAQLLSSQMLATPAVNASELIHSTALQTFAAATIEAFDLTDANHAERHAAEAIVSSVDSYLRDHLGEQLTVGEVARSLHLSLRGLQIAYQQTGHGTVVGHLRRLRLEGAHAALLERRGSTTVTAVARRFGYTNMGRFSAQYRAQYGHSPAATLQRTPRRSTVS